MQKRGYSPNFEVITFGIANRFILSPHKLEIRKVIIDVKTIKIKARVWCFYISFFIVNFTGKQKTPVGKTALFWKTEVIAPNRL